MLKFSSIEKTKVTQDHVHVLHTGEDDAEYPINGEKIVAPRFRQGGDVRMWGDIRVSP